MSVSPIFLNLSCLRASVMYTKGNQSCPLIPMEKPISVFTGDTAVSLGVKLI